MYVNLPEKSFLSGDRNSAASCMCPALFLILWNHGAGILFSCEWINKYSRLMSNWGQRPPHRGKDHWRLTHWPSPRELFTAFWNLFIDNNLLALFNWFSNTVHQFLSLATSLVLLVCWIFYPSGAWFASVGVQRSFCLPIWCGEALRHVLPISIWFAKLDMRSSSALAILRFECWILCLWWRRLRFSLPSFFLADLDGSLVLKYKSEISYWQVEILNLQLFDFS